MISNFLRKNILEDWGIN